MGKTFMSLFSQFSKEELCQLYIYPVIPNENRCASYYRITDKAVLKAVVTRRNPGREISAGEISPDQGLYENAGDQSFYKSRKNKSALRRLLRDAMWKLAPWYHKELKAWLDRENPDCIFVAPGVAKFLYDLALRIGKDRDLPIVTYICDEYYFVEKPKSLLDRLRLGLLRRKMERLMSRTAHLVVISQELHEAYAQRFGVKTTMLMTGAGIPLAEGIRRPEDPETLCYFGNIRCNRFVPLGQIGAALDRLNLLSGKHYRLKIFTAEKDPEILGPLEKIPSVDLCGFVSGADYEREFFGAGLLLHTEAFDAQSVDFTKHSVSTKIADSLASGIPVVAYGPACISSMNHLLRNRCAFTAVSPEELPQVLENAFRNGAARGEIVENALDTAGKYHDLRENGRMLREILEQAVRREFDEITGSGV